MLTDRLAAWLDAAEAGRGRLAELQTLEDEIHASYESLGLPRGEVERILHAACEDSLRLYLEVLEMGYDFLERGLDLTPAREKLSEAYCAMGRYDALVEQVRLQLCVPVERGTG